MTQLELVEIDPTPGGNGLPDLVTIIAVSTSWAALSGYCEKKYKQTPDIKPKSMWDIRYEIRPSKIVIVQENISKF